MNISELKIGDKVRYETYYGGIKINTFGIIDSELKNDYFGIRNLITNKQQCSHHKDSIIAKVLENGANYKETRIDTHVRRFNLDDNIFALGNDWSHCLKCDENINPELLKEIKDRINYFYRKIDGTFEFPNSAEGDLLKMVNKLLK